MSESESKEVGTGATTDIDEEKANVDAPRKESSSSSGSSMNSIRNAVPKLDLNASNGSMEPSRVTSASTARTDRATSRKLTSDAASTKATARKSIVEFPLESELVFIPPDEGTPAAEALAANAAIQLSKTTKGLQRKWQSLKRPKMKNFNVVKQLKKRTKQSKKKHFTKNFKGKVIDGVHELYTLTIGMMLGVRCSIGHVSPDDELLISEDFNQVEKRTFAPMGTKDPHYTTPPHQLAHTFKFKSYAPKVFKRIRKFFDIDTGSYMMSVCGNYNFLEFISNSKSGQFFFYSHDGKYMIKTQTKEENKFMKRILPYYFQFLTENPHTLLVRFLGMYRVKMYHLRRKVHFVIMSSVFDSPEQIHTIYDLKGSLIGREASEKERASGGVLKDKDLVKDGVKLHFASKKQAFIEQIERDTMFLATLNIMDYSLLVGIHHRDKLEEDGAGAGRPESAGSTGGTMLAAAVTTIVVDKSQGNGVSTVSSSTTAVTTNGNSGVIHSHLPPHAHHPAVPMHSNTPFRDKNFRSTDPEESMALDSMRLSHNQATHIDTSIRKLSFANMNPADLLFQQQQLQLLANSQHGGGGDSVGNNSGRSDVTPPLSALDTAQIILVEAKRKPSLSGPPSNEVNVTRTTRRRQSKDKETTVVTTVVTTGGAGGTGGVAGDTTPPRRRSSKECPGDGGTTSRRSSKDYNDSVNGRGDGSARQDGSASGGEDTRREINEEDEEYDEFYTDDETDADGNEENVEEEEEEDDDGDSLIDENGDVCDIHSLAHNANKISGESPVRNIGVGIIGKEGAHISRVFRESSLQEEIQTRKKMASKLKGSPVPNVPEKPGPDILENRVVYGPGMSHITPWSSRKDHGINSRVGSKRGSEIYFVGIIDVLQQYNFHKWSETKIKSLTNDSKQISSVDALSYAKRFVQFMKDNID